MSDGDGRRERAWWGRSDPPAWLTWLFLLQLIACFLGPFLLASLVGPWAGAFACPVACFVNYWTLDRWGPPGWRLGCLPSQRNLFIYLVNGLVFAMCLAGIARDWFKP